MNESLNAFSAQFNHVIYVDPSVNNNLSDLWEDIIGLVI